MEFITYLDVIDQLRYILGTVLAFFVFFHNVAPKREHFVFRILTGLSFCLIASTGYIGLLWFYQSGYSYEAYSILAVIYWIIMMFIVVGYIRFCYHVSLGHALFRGFMAFALESLVTTILKYFIVGMLLPDLPQKYTISYILLSVMVYLIFYGVIYQVLAKRIQVVKSAETLDNRKTVVTYTLLCIFLSLINDASRGVCEWMVKPMEEYTHMGPIIWTFQAYSNGVMLLFCIIILLMQYYVFEIAVLQNEKTLFEHLLIERKMQYEHSRDNIDIINQKCHELKKKIIELERATGEERQEMIQETKKAVMFYDSVVKTSNEVLNTVLTEKSLYCANRNINLTCMANAEHLSYIEGIDLYTLLENALDNAITCAEALTDEEKKAVAISIYERGKMLYMSIENYYEKPIPMRNGTPVISKTKRGGDGTGGLQTIRMIAKKYGGDIRITTELQIFILQITLPFSDPKKAKNMSYVPKK